MSATRQRLAASIESSLASWPQDDVRTFARQLSQFVAQGPFAAPTH